MKTLSKSTVAFIGLSVVAIALLVIAIVFKSDLFVELFTLVCLAILYCATDIARKGNAKNNLAKK